MSPADYALAHGLTVAYVWRLIRAGRLPCERINDKRRYVIPENATYQRMKGGKRKVQSSP